MMHMSVSYLLLDRNYVVGSRVFLINTVIEKPRFEKKSDHIRERDTPVFPHRTYACER